MSQSAAPIPFHQVHRRAIFWTTLVAVLAAVIWTVLRFVSPTPPRTLVMTTGAPDGAYHRFGLRYQEILKANGVTLELHTSGGSVENLQRLDDGQASVGFVQGGTGVLALDPDASPDSTPLRSLATVAFEPVWIFTHTLDASKGLDVLAGKKVAVGVPGSGNQTLARQLMAVYGIEEKNDLVDEGGMAVVDLLSEHRIDAAIVIAAPRAPVVQKLLSDSSMHLISLRHVEGLARRFPFFQPVVLKRGSVDPRRDLPPQDVHLLATTANLVIRDEVHPALAYLLLEAAREVHKVPGLLNRPGEFPSPKDTDFPLADEAERYFKNGRPFLQNYLPFWAANYVQRLILLLVPLAAIIVPLARVLPEVIAWRRQSRLFRRYGELRFLEEEIGSRELDAQQLAQAHERLDRIETDIARTRFPHDFVDRVYILRQHVDYVRLKLNQRGKAAPSTRET